MCFTFKMLMDLYFGLFFAKKWNMMHFLGDDPVHRAMETQFR